MLNQAITDIKAVGGTVPRIEVATVSDTECVRHVVYAPSLLNL